MGDPRGPWQDYGHENDPDEGYDADGYSGDGYLDDIYGDGYDGPAGTGPGDAGAGRWSPQALAADLAWRYRSAPLWARVTADITAATLVLALIVGVSLALRQEGAPPPASADRAATRAAVVTTTTTLAPTTGTTGTPKHRPTTTTTTAPTTPTTEAPTTPTTAPPSTTTTAPTTTTTESIHFRNCSEARDAGALPLRAGDPGYGLHLDRDGDGEACEWNDRWR